MDQLAATRAHPMYRTRLCSAGPSGANVLAGGPRAAAGADCISADCRVRLLGGVPASGRMRAAAFLLRVAFRDTIDLLSSPLPSLNKACTQSLCRLCFVCEHNVKPENGDV